MGRKIRFRVWDDVGRKMYYPEEAKFCVTMVGSVCDDETEEGGILENRSYRMTALLDTGLHDKNGNELWESDLITNAYRNQGKPHLIEFWEGKFIARYGNLRYDIANEEVEEIERVGNVFEHSHLLEGKEG